MDINKFTEAARYMSIIQGYEHDLELLERECNPAKIVLFKDGGIVSEINDLEIRNQVRCFLRRKIDYYQHKFDEL
jgi:hypothetical protein